jgi:hypothetical protein
MARSLSSREKPLSEQEIDSAESALRSLPSLLRRAGVLDSHFDVLVLSLPTLSQLHFHRKWGKTGNGAEYAGIFGRDYLRNAGKEIFDIVGLENRTRTGDHIIMCYVKKGLYYDYWRIALFQGTSAGKEPLRILEKVYSAKQSITREVFLRSAHRHDLSVRRKV